MSSVVLNLLKRKKDTQWWNSPFFALWRGYVKVYAGGDSDGKGTHVSVFILLINEGSGPYKMS